MKTIVCCLLIVCCVWAGQAAPLTSAERVQFRDGKLWVWQAGAALQATDSTTLPFDIVIETNGTYTVASGRVRQLLQGEILGADGMLLRPDGGIVPVIDHVTMNRGQVLVMTDGDYQALNSITRLRDGSAIRPDGKLTNAQGLSRRLLDGEIFQLHVPALPARDTITVQDGRVFVQKDGAMIALGAGRTIMMNNGTKVFADGSFVDFNGTRSSLNDGDIRVIEGVLVRSR